MATAMQQDVSEKQIRPVDTPEPAKPSKRRFILPIVGVLVFIALIWAFKQWSYGRAHESTDMRPWTDISFPFSPRSAATCRK
jgi:multidrug resistance efflux pump